MYVACKKIWPMILIFAMAGVFVQTINLSAQQETSRRSKKEVKPEYPHIAHELKLSGTVKVTVVVSPNGTVKSAHATGGHPVLLGPAEDAAKHWEFEPADKETSQVLEFQFKSGT